MKKLMLASATSALVAGSAYAAGHAETVNIGVILGFTGPIESLTPMMAESAELALTEINESRMGLAVVVDQEACIAFQGLRCEVCFNVCPIRGKAITLDYQHNSRSGKHALFIPVVHSNACTGCGKCEKACILDEAAVKVFPIALAKGLLGRHYRLGWEQKAEAGRALVTPDAPHRYNLPEGMRYEHGGEGLIMGERPPMPSPPPRPVAPEPPESPFSSNPLDTLNRKGGL